MNQISPYPVWIGYDAEGHDFSRVLDEGVEALVDLAAEEPTRAGPRDLIACRFPLIDGSGNRPELLVLAVQTVAGLVAAGVPTLVCCSAGLSRSPAVVAAALSLHLGETPQSCLKRVTSHHPSDVAPRLWADILGILPRTRKPVAV
jgi:hypothetical protein